MRVAATVSLCGKCVYSWMYERISILGLTMAERLKHGIPASDCFIALDRLDISNATVKQPPATSSPRLSLPILWFAAPYRYSRGMKEEKIDSLLLRAFDIISATVLVPLRTYCTTEIDADISSFWSLQVLVDIAFISSQKSRRWWMNRLLLDSVSDWVSVW